MIVSTTKRREVLAALEQCVLGGDIVLRGPSGSGKTTALESACKDLNIRILRYKGIDGDISVFLGSALRALCSKRTVIYCQGSDALAFYCRNPASTFTHLPICKVFSIDEGAPEYYTAIQKLPWAKFISFNAFSEYAITKQLIENVVPHRLWEAQSIIQGCGGDIRQAKNQLRSAGIFNEEKGQLVSVNRKRTKPAIQTEEVEIRDSMNIESKDAMYSFFHILGKILYNKEGTIRNIDYLVDDPIITNAGYNTVDWIQENLIDFAVHVEELSSVYGTTSLVDSWRRKVFDCPSIATCLVFKSVCMRPLNNNVGNKRGFKPLRKPSIYACNSRAHDTAMQISQQRKAGASWLTAALLPLFSQISISAYFPTDMIDSDPIEDCE
jgi:hypothetical protein